MSSASHSFGAQMLNFTVQYQHCREMNWNLRAFSGRRLLLPLSKTQRNTVFEFHRTKGNLVPKCVKRSVKCDPQCLDPTYIGSLKYMKSYLKERGP